MRGWTVSGDTLSDLLRAVRFRGALFYFIEGASPWVAEAPPAAEIIPAILPGAEHMIEFHGVVKGSCWAAIAGESPLRLEEGDVVLFPQGDPHVMSSAPGMRAPGVDRSFFFSPRPPQLPYALSMTGAEITTARLDGGGGTRPRSPAASWASTRGPSTPCWPRSHGCCGCPGAPWAPTRG